MKLTDLQDPTFYDLPPDPDPSLRPGHRSRATGGRLTPTNFLPADFSDRYAGRVMHRLPLEWVVRTYIQTWLRPAWKPFAEYCETFLCHTPEWKAEVNRQLSLAPRPAGADAASK